MAPFAGPPSHRRTIAGQRPDPLIIEAKGRHTATAILNHGLGYSAYDWVAVVEKLSSREELEGVRWILPNAPRQTLTVVSYILKRELVRLDEPSKLTGETGYGKGGDGLVRRRTCLRLAPQDISLPVGCVVPRVSGCSTRLTACQRR